MKTLYFTWWTNTHNSSIMHDMHRTFTNLTFSFTKITITNTQNSSRLDWDYGEACDLNSSVNMDTTYLRTHHFTCSSHAWVIFRVHYQSSIQSSTFYFARCWSPDCVFMWPWEHHDQGSSEWISPMPTLSKMSCRWRALCELWRRNIFKHPCRV